MEARLEGMAPEIDGKLYLTDVELPGGEIAATGDMVRVEIQNGFLRSGSAALWRLRHGHLCSGSLRRFRRSAYADYDGRGAAR